MAYLIDSLNTQITETHSGSLPARLQYEEKMLSWSVAGRKDPMVCPVGSRSVVFCDVTSWDTRFAVAEEVMWCYILLKEERFCCIE